MCVSETYIRGWVRKRSSDTFPNENGLKQGDTLLPFLFSFVQEYAIGGVQVNQDGLKLNGTHWPLVYAGDVSIVGGSIFAIMTNTEAVVFASKEIGLEVNAAKTKYMVMSRDQNAGRVTI